MKNFCLLLLAFGLLATTPAVAQWAEIPTGNLDTHTARTQAKVESLYQRGSYKRAHFIYKNELARQGDKYAQYMAGYMYQMGQGVDEDPVAASAWYRIAAERRAPEFVAVRDQALQMLNDEQRARSDALYLELRKEYSDIVVIMKLLRDDLESLESASTGSRLKRSSSSVMVVDPHTGKTISAAALRSRTLRTAQARLDYVTNRLDLEKLNAEQAEQQMSSLWERVNDYLSVIDDVSDGLYAAP